MGFMAIVNLVSILLLGKWALRALDDYTAQRKAAQGPGVPCGGRCKACLSGMSVLLAAVLVAGLAPALPAKAFGDEGGSPEPTVFLGEAVCSSPAATVTAAFTIRNSNETASPVANVAVADGQAVPASAKYTLVEVVSDLPFADGLSSATVRLGDSFEGLQVTSVERTGDNTAVVRVEGGAPSGSDGFIVFDEGSFTDGRAVGGAAVSVEAATLSFRARRRKLLRERCLHAAGFG